jgi:hypothetical protein
MLSKSGNPTMDSLALIFGAMKKILGVEIEVKTVKMA